MITLSQLAIYPIKSTAQISLTNAYAGPFGLHMDRRWMLVDNEGHMLTQRILPQMCLISSTTQNDQLIVSAPNMPTITLKQENGNKKLVNVTVWTDACEAYDYGDEIAGWFSGFLGISARLVYFPDKEIRQVDPEYAIQGDITAFSDGFPYLLIGQASLDNLNERLDHSIEMKRFRPNLVISGAEAFAEDSWKKIRIGELTFRVVKSCSRCPIPCIDPETAEKSPEVLKELALYRKRDNKVFFGQNLIAEGCGELNTGMTVEIIE